MPTLITSSVATTVTSDQPSSNDTNISPPERVSSSMTSTFENASPNSQPSVPPPSLAPVRRKSPISDRPSCFCEDPSCSSEETQSPNSQDQRPRRSRSSPCSNTPAGNAWGSDPNLTEGPAAPTKSLVDGSFGDEPRSSSSSSSGISPVSSSATAEEHTHPKDPIVESSPASSPRQKRAQSLDLTDLRPATEVHTGQPQTHTHRNRPKLAPLAKQLPLNIISTPVCPEIVPCTPLKPDSPKPKPKKFQPRRRVAAAPPPPPYYVIDTASNLKFDNFDEFKEKTKDRRTNFRKKCEARSQALTCRAVSLSPRHAQNHVDAGAGNDLCGNNTAIATGNRRSFPLKWDPSHSSTDC